MTKPKESSDAHFGSRSLFTPEVLLASQWPSTRKLNPYQMLAKAVLEEAMESLKCNATVSASANSINKVSQRRRLHTEALDWVKSREEDGICLRFVNLCHSLGINPDWLRKAILANPRLNPKEM